MNKRNKYFTKILIYFFQKNKNYKFFKYLKYKKVNNKIKKLNIFNNKILNYNTNFNVKTNINIYESGDLFKYIINKEKKEK